MFPSCPDELCKREKSRPMLKYKILCFLFCISGVLIVSSNSCYHFIILPISFRLEVNVTLPGAIKKISKISKSDLNVISVTSIKARKFDMALSNSEKS